MGQGWKTTLGVGWMCFAKNHLWASSPGLDSSGVEQRVTTAAAGSTAHFWDQGRAQGLHSPGVWREANKKFEGWKRQGQVELREGGINSRRIPVLDPSPQERLGTGLSTGRSGNDSILSTREWRNCFKLSKDSKKRQPKTVAKVGRAGVQKLRLSWVLSGNVGSSCLQMLTPARVDSCDVVEN